jgi:hypothetical protein
MKKEKWNPVDWQGRTKLQIEGNAKIMGYTFLVLAGITIGYVFTKLIMYVLV